MMAYISYAVPLKEATGQDDWLIKDKILKQNHDFISSFKGLQSGWEPFRHKLLPMFYKHMSAYFVTICRNQI